MGRQPITIRMLARILAILALSAMGLLKQAISAEHQAQVAVTPPAATAWTTPGWNSRRCNNAEFGQCTDKSGLGYPGYRMNRLGYPANHHIYRVEPGQESVDRIRYRLGRPGQGPRPGGHGMGYPGFRGHGGKQSPRHRGYGTPPLHLPNAGYRK